MAGRPQGLNSLYTPQIKGCRTLSTERVVYKNKHKNKAFINLPFVISIAGHSSTGWLNFVQKVPLGGGKSLYLPAIPFTFPKQARGAWWISLPVLK